MKSRLALTLALVVCVLPSALNVSAVNAAEASAEIPGVPMPGPIAAGRLGGAIYDVVYSVDVAPGHVIVASLTGAVGTDFDIYLFDSTATSVLSNVGLLTKSTGPTSAESISWPSRLGGTYYIDLNGATDLEGDYRLTVQVVPDPTPPTVSLALAGGRTATNLQTVPVTLTATDDLSGVAEMALSSDGTTFAAWEPLQAFTTWTFPPGDGPVTLWAKVRNGVGLESAIASATVMIDSVPPSVASIDPLPGSTVVGLRPRFSVRFSEAMDPASWMDLGLIVQSATGALVPGQYTYDGPTRTGNFTPTQALQAGGLYLVTVGNARDIAGNRVNMPGSWSITPLTATSLTVTAAPSVIIRGGSARLDVQFTGPRSATLDVQTSTSAGAFVPLSSIPAEEGSLVVTPGSNTIYRFRYPGSFGVAAAEATTRVLVRRSVALVGLQSTVIASGRIGRPITLTAEIGPVRAGVSVSFRLYRFDTRRRAWVYAGSRGRNTDAAGRATLSWSPSSSGLFYWRAAVASSAEFANNTSPVYRWSISR